MWKNRHDSIRQAVLTERHACTLSLIRHCLRSDGKTLAEDLSLPNVLKLDAPGEQHWSNITRGLGG
jgi:hypothetical protein